MKNLFFNSTPPVIQYDLFDPLMRNDAAITKSNEILTGVYCSLIFVAVLVSGGWAL